MRPLLNIITITKDDFEGISSTILSTKNLRELFGVQQIVIDSSAESIAGKIKVAITQEKNIRYIWHAPLGISSAFNRGVEAADANWVWFLNGRDEVNPDLKLDMFLDVISSSHADLLIFELIFMQSQTRYSHPPIFALWPPVQFWVPHPATIVRRETFEKHGMFSERYKIAMDGEIWFRFFSKGVLVDMLSIPISLYDEGGLSRQELHNTAKESKTIIMSYRFMLLYLWIQSGLSVVKFWRHFHKRSRIK